MPSRFGSRPYLQFYSVVYSSIHASVLKFADTNSTIDSFVSQCTFVCVSVGESIWMLTFVIITCILCAHAHFHMRMKKARSNDKSQKYFFFPGFKFYVLFSLQNSLFHLHS